VDLADLVRAMSRLLREPLVHFAALGVIVFAAYALLGRQAAPVGGALVVSAETVATLAHGLPGGDPSGVRERVERYVDDELLYREGVARELHRDDPIVRRRLIQKMRFLAEDAGDTEPTEAELAGYLASHASDYATTVRVRFHQLFYAHDRWGSQARARAEAGLTADPFPGNDPSTTLATAAELAKSYGARFADAVIAAPTGAWSVPIESSLGVHRVFVDERRPAEVARLAQVRSRVRLAVLEERRRAAYAESLRRLRDKYDVTIGTP
jgi:hypothetical protein